MYYAILKKPKKTLIAIVYFEVACPRIYKPKQNKSPPHSRPPPPPNKTHVVYMLFDCLFVYLLFVCLPVVLRSTREYLDDMETSPLTMKGRKRLLLGTNGLLR